MVGTDAEEALKGTALLELDSCAAELPDDELWQVRQASRLLSKSLSYLAV
jgi:hypothetical protein